LAAGEVWLDEVFLSLQGEGGETGKVHLFLRLAGCPLRCKWCDTPRSWTRRKDWELHLKGETRLLPNPVSVEELEGALEDVFRSHGMEGFRPVLAVTGGEPLEQAPFLLSWLPRWQGRVMLETAGVDAPSLARVLPWVDQLSLDWKIPSSLEQGGELSTPDSCLREASRAGVETWVKVVVSEDESPREWMECLEAISMVSPGARVWLQPATPTSRGPLPPSGESLLETCLALADLDLDLRVQAQVHPLLGVR